MEHIDETLALGNLLRDIREAIGMSRQDLAEKVGCKYEDIRLYERGERIMRIDRLFRILNVLGVRFSKDLLDVRMYESVVGLAALNSEQRNFLISKIHAMIAKASKNDGNGR